MNFQLYFLVGIACEFLAAIIGLFATLGGSNFVLPGMYYLDVTVA